MLEISDVKPNQLIWWTHVNSTFNEVEFDCPCIITEVEANRFKIISFDDMIESDWLRIGGSDKGSSRRHEMRAATREEVDAYLAKRHTEVEETIRRDEQRVKACQQMFRARKRLASKLLAKV